MNIGASLVVQMVKNLPAMRKTPVPSLDREDALEEGVATHSSNLAWSIPWTEEPGGATVHGGRKDLHMTEPLTPKKTGLYLNALKPVCRGHLLWQKGTLQTWLNLELCDGKFIVGYTVWANRITRIGQDGVVHWEKDTTKGRSHVQAFGIETLEKAKGARFSPGISERTSLPTTQC